MRKSIIVLILGMVSAGHTNADVYVQGNVARSTVEANEDKAPSVRVAVGKDAGAFRYMADYTNFGKFGYKSHHQFGTDSVSLSVNSLGVSAIADIPNGSRALAPYVGARVGVNRLADKDVMVTQQEAVTEKKNYTTIGAGLLAGVQYNVSQNLAVDAGVEYSRLGQVKIKDEFGNVVDKWEPTQKSLNLGVRYNF